MYHIVSKVFTFFITPQGIICILLIYAICIKNRTKFRRTIIATLIFFYCFSTFIITNELIRLWEWKPTAISTIKSHDIGIILTGGTILSNKFPTENIFLGGTSDRIGQTLQLYKMGKIKKILISGGEVPIFGKYKSREIDQIARYLILCGIPKTDIYLEEHSTNTRENALNSNKILQKQFPNQSCILITSAFHMKRAMQCFKKVGIEVTPYAANFLSEESKWSAVEFLPEPKNLYHIQIVFREIIGYISYRIFGWV